MGELNFRRNYSQTRFIWIHEMMNSLDWFYQCVIAIVISFCSRNFGADLPSAQVDEARPVTVCHHLCDRPGTSGPRQIPQRSRGPGIGPQNRDLLSQAQGLSLFGTLISLLGTQLTRQGKLKKLMNYWNCFHHKMVKWQQRAFFSFWVNGENWIKTNIRMCPHMF